MRLYAHSPAVRYRQILRDAIVFLWCAAWVWLGVEIYRLVNKIGVAGTFLQSAASHIGAGTGGPSILRAPANALNSVGEALGNAGGAEITAAHDLALAMGIGVAAVPVTVALVHHARKRLRWMRAALAVEKLRHAPHFGQLMAQRALINQPLERLLAASPDPVADFAAGHFEQLAALELEPYAVKPRQ